MNLNFKYSRRLVADLLLGRPARPGTFTEDGDDIRANFDELHISKDSITMFYKGTEVAVMTLTGRVFLERDTLRLTGLEGTTKVMIE